VTTVALVGLGIMGSAYAGHLLDAGHAVRGFDVDEGALRRFADRGGVPAASPASAADGARVVITALPSVAAAEAVFEGGDGLTHAARGTVVVEASTLPLDAKQRCREVLALHGVDVLDAPVSGTGPQARAKDLTVYASGELAAYEVAEPVLRELARVVRYVGAYGTGSKLKYIANLLVTIHNLSTAEAVVLAQKAGLDPAAMIEIVGEGAGASRMLAVRGPMMAAGSYDDAGMKLDVYQKDIEIIADFAREVGAPTPLFSQSAVFYTAALAQGRGKQDTAAIASVLKTMAGLPADP
jgi:3-hydroxyisobutyrate dehydrogenase-like beta-hydroxyacid dehydrogenase